MPLVDVINTIDPLTPRAFIRSAIARVLMKQPNTLISNTRRQPSGPSSVCCSIGMFGEIPIELIASEISCPTLATASSRTLLNPGSSLRSAGAANALMPSARNRPSLPTPTHGRRCRSHSATYPSSLPLAAPGRIINDDSRPAKATRRRNSGEFERSVARCATSSSLSFSWPLSFFRRCSFLLGRLDALFRRFECL
jgi:hypothetical protein